MATTPTTPVNYGVEYSVKLFKHSWYHSPAPTIDVGASKELWCKGITIDAEIKVRRYEPQPGRRYDVGLVQILDYSNQVALYEKAGPAPGVQAPITHRFKIVSWEQRHLPVFDGDPTDKLFYDANSCKEITGTGRYSVQLVDNPTLKALKTDFSQQHHRPYNLVRMLKYNKFHVLLIVRRCHATNKQDGIWCDYLRDFSWATKAEASFDQNFNETSHYRSTSSSFKPLEYVTAWSPIRRNLNLYKANAANQDQKIESYKDFLGFREFQHFTIDRYMPTVTV